MSDSPDRPAAELLAALCKDGEDCECNLPSPREYRRALTRLDRAEQTLTAVEKVVAVGPFWDTDTDAAWGMVHDIRAALRATQGGQ